MLDLHFWPTPNGKKVTILLEELGLDYNLVPCNIGRGDQFKPEFLRINPNHRMPVLVDSGFRRGSDIVKALAIGARAVCIGRPYLWGLGAFGQPGVERVLGILRNETRTAMQQLGAPSLKDLTPAMVRRI